MLRVGPLVSLKVKVNDMFFVYVGIVKNTIVDVAIVTASFDPDIVAEEIYGRWIAVNLFRKSQFMLIDAIFTKGYIVAKSTGPTPICQTLKIGYLSQWLFYSIEIWQGSRPL